MNRYLPVRKVYVREVLDSRGNPTVMRLLWEKELCVGKEDIPRRAIVPFRCLYLKI